MTYLNLFEDVLARCSRIGLVLPAQDKVQLLELKKLFALGYAAGKRSQRKSPLSVLAIHTSLPLPQEPSSWSMNWVFHLVTGSYRDPSVVTLFELRMPKYLPAY